MSEYQREKDGYPDVAMCHECGVFMPDAPINATLCETCDWDLHGAWDAAAEET